MLFSTLRSVALQGSTTRLAKPPRRWLTSLSIGEDTYQRALKAFQQADEHGTKLEEDRNLQQYQAYERAQQAEKSSDIRSGVAVVKTIAKQVRKQSPDESKQQELVKRAHDLLEEAALHHGHATALVRLGNLALEQDDDAKRAIELYILAGEAGASEGWFNVGNILWAGYEGAVEADVDESMEAFQKAIDLGDADAMYFVGVQYLSNDDDVSKHAEGLGLVESAGAKGHGGALYYLAIFYYNGNEPLTIKPCSTPEFCRRLDLAATAGDGDALFARGHAYYHGQDGRDLDPTKALEDFVAAADAGHSDAAVSAGALLHSGAGVKQDQRRAFELYQMAGELGSKEGWRNVVACYASGEGVPQSSQTAKYIANTMLLDESE